jgi:DNA-binding NarL/FixJ family response regulator
MPYPGARSGILIGLACAALGDVGAASLELDNAGATLRALGAAPDLDRLADLGHGRRPARAAPGADTTTAGGLTAREREVLAHLAAGVTNREIANRLVISQHSVGRHVENIFAKLGVTSRAAATAYAYEHGLL